MLSQHIKGVGAAPGLNIGQAIWWRKEKPVVETRSISDTDAEVEKLNQAIEKAREQIQELRSIASQRMSDEEAAVFDASEYERIRVCLKCERREQRVDNKCYEEHASDEEKDELSIVLEDPEAARRYALIYKAHDTERSKVYDPADYLGYCICCVLKHHSCMLACEDLECDTEEVSPEQDADVVCCSK